MDFAVLTSPMWWMARQWLRFLTGLAIIAVALGPVRVAPAVALQAAPAGTVQAVSTAGAEPLRPVLAPGADRPIVELDPVVELAPIVTAPSPVRVGQQRPVDRVEPASAGVAPVGRRAPPAAAGPL